MYDQLGCGNSSIPDDHPEIYTQETWVKELENLRQRLHLNKIHLLGQSWGGMLVIIYMCDYHPQGIQSLILSSTLSSASLWSKELHRLIKYLPIEEQAAIHRAELTHNFSDGAYFKANKHFMDQHVLKTTYKTPEPVRRKRLVELSLIRLHGDLTNTRLKEISMTTNIQKRLLKSQLQP